MYFVMGATGNIGGATLEALVADGQPVRALSRAPRDWPEGVEGLVGDLSTAGKALDGVEAAFLLSGYDGTEDFLAALRGAGAQRVVLLSSSAAPTGDRTNAVARYHIETEDLVRASGLGWTFLQPNSFHANALRWLPQLAQGDVVGGPFGDVPVASVDPADIGAAAALALTTGDHDGRAYRLSGPEALRPGQQVAILGEALGRNLRFDAWSDERARAELERQMPTPYVDAFFAFFRDGLVDETTVRPTVAELLGRPPGGFAAWAESHAGAFRTD